MNQPNPRPDEHGHPEVTEDEAREATSETQRDLLKLTEAKTASGTDMKIPNSDGTILFSKLELIREKGTIELTCDHGSSDFKSALIIKTVPLTEDADGPTLDTYYSLEQGPQGTKISKVVEEGIPEADEQQFMASAVHETKDWTDDQARDAARRIVSDWDNDDFYDKLDMEAQMGLHIVSEAEAQELILAIQTARPINK